MRPVLAATLAAVLAVACGTRQAAVVAGAPPDPDAGPGVSLVVPAPAGPTAASLFEVTYATPAGELYRRYVDALTLDHVADVALGAGAAIASLGDELLVEDGASVDLVDAAGARRTILRQRSLPVALAAGGLVYLGDQELVHVLWPNGDEVRSFEAPRARPGTPALPLGFKGLAYSAGSIVREFLRDGDTTYAVVQSPANAAVLDLSSSRRVDVNGLSPVLDAATLPGHAYLLGFDSTRVAHELQVVDVDLAGLAVSRVATLAVKLPARGLDGARLATAGGTLFAYLDVPSAAGEAPQRDILLRFDAALDATTIALPDDLGLDLAAGADDALYLFGGAAGNVVTRVDPSTGALVRYTVAPQGTFVRALAVR